MRKFKSLRYAAIGLLALVAAAPAVWCADLPTVRPLRARLADEVRKMIDAGHLAPGLSLFEQHYRYDVFQHGWNFDDYWHNPAELVYTLSIAMPLLPAALQPEAKAYLQSEFERFPPYEYIHIGPEGARRESAPLPPSLGETWPQAYGQESAPATAATYGSWSFNPFNAYACFKYAELFPSRAKPILDRLRNKIGALPQDAALLELHPHIVNIHIAGYYGYLGLQRLAGEAPDGAVQSWLQDALQTRVQLLSLDPKRLEGFEAGGFMWLVPELGDFLFLNAKDLVEQAVDYHNWAAPYWFIAAAQETTRVSKRRSLSEGYTSHVYEYMSQFQVRAWALKWPAERLEKYLDVSSTARGDLYYIQNLAAAIQAGSPRPEPPAEPVFTTPRMRATPARAAALQSDRP